MKRLGIIAVSVASLAILGAVMNVRAALQRPTGTVVSGATSGGTPETLLTDSSGNLMVKGTLTPSGTYPTPYLSGILAIASGSTSTITTGAVDVTALSVTNVSAASVTVNVMDASGNYIYPPSFVIPAGQSVAFPVGGGLLYSGVTASASVAGAAKINVGGYQ